jgi:radical SAM protein with 4Fe4S-binding SPASM domain
MDLNVLGIEVNNRSSSLQAYEEISEPDTAKSALKKWIRKHFAKRVFPVCPYAFSHLHVLYNGNVPLCVNDFEHREIMGNVNQQSIREIYNSERFQQIREMMVQGKYDEIETCRHCTLWKDSNWL